MLLQLAELNDILLILKDNFGIWAQGLSQSNYRAFMALQLKEPWMRKNFCYLAYKVQGQVVASCKVHFLDLRARGQSFRFACLSAVYTQQQFRNQGYAKRMLDAVIDRCKSQGIEGIMLFSDIDPSFYEKFDFIETGCYDFFIRLPALTDSATKVSTRNIDDALRSRGFGFAIDENTISQMTLHHRRWLRRQSYGIERSQEYFQFKFAKESFLSKHVRPERAELRVFSFRSTADEFVYAITEISGNIMRVLEVIGSEAARLELWAGLFDTAKEVGLSGIRGWESAISDIAPGFTSYVSLPSYKFVAEAPEIECYERDWGKPMILPISETVLRLSDFWVSTYPCPLLELDHF